MANGKLDISGVTGGTTITTLSGSGVVALGAKMLTLSNASGTFSGALGGSGGLTLAGGTESLSGTSNYAGATTVNGGTLSVTGSIATSSGVAINSGATLNGTGTVSSVTVNGGGTLMPGLPAAAGQLNISGSMVFGSMAAYLITINGAASSKTVASGTATLNSGASLSIAAGSTINIGLKYAILTANHGVSGTFNPTVTFGALGGTLSYDDPNDVFITFGFNQVSRVLPADVPQNVVSVATAIDAFTAGGGMLPAGFQNIFQSSPQQIVNAVTQLAGEEATGAQFSGFQLMNQVMALLIDPLADGHGGGGIGPLLFAAGEPETVYSPEVANAYASVLKAPPRAAPFAASQPWRAWGAGYGGSNRIAGDAGAGSHDISTQAGGFAAGLDYLASPNTRFGFALAGAGTGWSLSAALGSGHSDAFQAGLYGTHQFGAAYLSGALAFTNYWASTRRVVTVAGTDTLDARFDAQSFGGRLESGYRLNVMPVTVTPYAALQAQSFRAPAFSETAASGSPQFALSFNSQTSTTQRAELGSWLGRNLLLADANTLALFGRVAWAHDWFNGIALTPSFQALPGASFIVNGARPPADLALVTAGAELHLNSSWTLTGRFDGEFGNGQQTYTGTARVRYTW